MATRRSTKGIGEQGKGMKVFVLVWVGLVGRVEELDCVGLDRMGRVVLGWALLVGSRLENGNQECSGASYLNKLVRHGRGGS